MIIFQFLWLFDTIIALTAVGGFIFYLFRGPLSTAITGTWVLLLGVLLAMMLSAGWLRINQHPAPALLLLSILAAPGLVYLVLIIIKKLFRSHPVYTFKNNDDDFI